MSKRKILFVDSPIDENFYYYLCANIPNDLARDMLTFEQPLLHVFEQFYYTHKNDIIIKFYIADKLFVGFLGFFANLFRNTNSDDVRVMNEIIDGIYQKHTKEENYSIIHRHDNELLLTYLEEIEKSLSYIEGNNVQSMMARCHDIINDIISTQEIKYPSYDYAENIIFSYGNKIVNDAIKQWMESEEELLFFKNIHRPYEQSDSTSNISNWKVGEPELEIISKVGQEMSQLINKVTYEYDTVTSEDKDDFKNLWYFIVSVQYLGLMPSSFFKVVQKIVHE